MASDLDYEHGVYRCHLGEPHKFVLPGYEPDVLLNIFGQEVHAHSFMLRTLSAYFRKLLDAPNPSEQEPSSFSYRVMAVVNKDTQDWGWEKVPFLGPFDPTAHIYHMKGSYKKEISGCINVLRAIYGLSYSVAYGSETEEILALVRQGELYCVLPLLSPSLTTALLRAYGQCQFAPYSMIVTAEKLRNPTILRECVVYLVARWDRTDFDKNTQGLLKLRHPHLYNVVKKAYEDLCTKIKETDRKVMDLVSYERYDGLHRELWQDLKSGGGTGGGYLSKHYEGIPEKCQRMRGNMHIPLIHWKFYFDLEAIVSPITKITLFFPRRYLPPSCYCAEIEDKDLPWDLSQTEW